MNSLLEPIPVRVFVSAVRAAFLLVCGGFLAAAPAPAEELVVRTDYRALVLYYNPHVVIHGERLRVKDAYNYRDIDRLCADYATFLRKASGGQVNFSVAYRYELDEYPPETDPGVTFTPENYDQYRAEGYDIFNHAKADYVAICADPRFRIVPKVEAGRVDAVWIFAPDYTGFWEAAMAGEGAYWVNGGPYPEIACSRKFVLFGFGMADHQGVGFMLENTGHMIENIMHERIASGWPARHRVTGWTTLDLTNPDRAPVVRDLNDWGFFTSTDAVHWDAELVVPGGSQAGLSHFPPTACVNYGWSAPRFDFDYHWDAESFRVFDAVGSIGNGEYALSGGSGRAICYGSHDLRDDRGEYRVPMILTDADIEFGVRLDGPSPAGHAGLLFRCANYDRESDPMDGYYLGLNPGLGRLELARRDGGYHLLASHPLPLAAGTNYTLFVSLRGREVRVARAGGDPPLLIFDDLERLDGAVGFANRDTDASFSHLYLTPVIPNYAENWRTYPDLGATAEVLSPREWVGDDQPYGDMDYWYAWWYEHLPKNPGTHEIRGPGGELLGRALNSWWPYLFDINAFDQPLLPADSEVVSAPADLSPPDAPQALVASPLTDTRVRIEWAEPPDAIGVTRYEVYRDGVLLRRTPLAYLEDAGLPPDSEHGYYVIARDGSGNRSAPSAPVTVRTLPGEQDLVNGGFELGLLAPLAWVPVSLEGEAVLSWAPAGDGRNGGRCIAIESTAPAHAHWRQDLTGLVPDGRYLLTAWVKGQDVHGEPPGAPTAFVRVLGACEHTLPFLAGTFDWTEVSGHVFADRDGRLTLLGALGDWGSPASGIVWIDDVTLTYAPAAPQPASIWGLDMYHGASFPEGLAEVRDVRAGSGFFLALKTDGTVLVWGSNCSGQWSVPPDLTNGVAIAAGGDHCLALKADGTIRAWGGNMWGQTDLPPGLSDGIGVSAGTRFSAVLRSDGTVVAWGCNDRGEIDVPAGLDRVVAIDSGHEFSLALKADGTVAAWGHFLARDGDLQPAYVPPGLRNVVAVSCGEHHAVALHCDGTVTAWGDSTYGQTTVPPDLSPVVAVSAGGYHTLALLGDGSVAAWGGNQHGQTDVPPDLRNVRAVAAGMMSSLALLGTRPPTCRAHVQDPGLASGRFHITAQCRPGDPTFLLSAHSLHPSLWNVVTGAVTREPSVALVDPNPLSDQRYYSASRPP
jgi:hypothetical protein